MHGCESAGETAKPCKAKVQGDRKALQGEGAGDRRKCIARKRQIDRVF